MSKRRKVKRPTKLQATQRRLAAVEWMLVKAHELNVELAAENVRLCGLWKPPAGTSIPAELLTPLQPLLPSDAGLGTPCARCGVRSGVHDVRRQGHGFELPATPASYVDPSRSAELPWSLGPGVPPADPEPPPHGDEHAPAWVSVSHQQIANFSGDPHVLGPPCVRCGIRFDVHSMDAGHAYEAPPLVGAGDLTTEVQPPAKES